jgi:uncharacterized membrane protein (UPF0127 family)
MGCDVRRVRVVLGKQVIARVGLAQSSQTRLVGLLGRDSLESGDGLLISPDAPIAYCPFAQRGADGTLAPLSS